MSLWVEMKDEERELISKYYHYSRMGTLAPLQINGDHNFKGRPVIDGWFSQGDKSWLEHKSG